jgi:hypothetical protein
MALFIPTGFGQATFVMAAAGDPDSYVCTLGVDLSDVGGDNDAATLALGTAWATWIVAGQSNVLTFTAVELAVGQDGGPPLVVRRNFGEVGGLSGDFLPQNSAVLVSKNTAQAGRRGRGRNYIPLFVQSSQVDNIGIIETSVVTGLQDQLDSFWTDLHDGAPPLVAVPPVLLHGAALGPVDEPTPITSFSVERTIATQRRRLRH